ncbi:MAG: polysaccharide deacetylase family protein [Acidobacteriia bacterium]|nr:polysaccharide deacetylase family protein [Terriglobia bacterium]
MRRRMFLGSLLRAATAATTTQLLSESPFFTLSAGEFAKAAGVSKARPQIALTMDDPSLTVSARMDWQEANRRLLDTFEQRKLKIALFVCGMRVDQPEGRKLLGAWDEAGHLICNHSYSHLMYMQRTSYDEFAADFLRNEPVIAPFRQRTRLFRYPFLKEGDTAEKRDRFRALLKDHGYRVGHVTIDGSDWYVDQRMDQRLKRDPAAKVEPYRDYLIAHLLDRAAFYRQLSLDVLGHEIRHTLLVHYHEITALFLPDVIQAFERAGWEWIDASRAFADPVFQAEPKTLPAGESLVWALAAENGRFKDRLRWPGEDDTYEKPKMDALGL